MSTIEAAPSPPRSVPGPTGVHRLLNFLKYVRSPTGFLEQLVADHGPLLRFGLGPVVPYLITDPALITEVFLTHNAAFGRPPAARDLRMLVGRGLLTIDGDEWKRQRKLVAPPLRKAQIDAYAQAMVTRTEALVHTVRSGEARNITQDTTRLAMHIVVDALFGVDAPPEAERVGELMESAAFYFEKLLFSPLMWLPRWWPSAARRAFLADLKRIDHIVNDLIEARRSDPSEGNDLLFRLLHATYDDGSVMSAQQLRDEVTTIFLAGHETTALTLGFALWELARRPAVQQALHQEVDQVLGGRSATAADVSELRWCRAIFDEALRLYPPVWAGARQALRDVTIGGCQIKKGDRVVISPWVLHRQERFYARPREFDPQRWLDGLAEQLPRHAYIPFGGGPRICVGNHFALMEGVLVLATLAQHLQFGGASETLPLRPTVTLRTAGPVQLAVTRR